MLSVLGQTALTAALVSFFVAAVCSIKPYTQSSRATLAKIGFAIGCIAAFVSFLVLMVAFVKNDFTIAYVVSHSSLKLPLLYRISATWGAHEGSLLMWIFLMCVWSAIAWLTARHIEADIRRRLLAWLSVLLAIFCAFTLFTSNPFVLMEFVVKDGYGFNPLLQDIGQAFHPPMLYSGYVGFAIAFAFALAALPSESISRHTWRWLRPFCLVPWALLTMGITLGSWWAYRELGWGGFWFWDPVENASLLPWLLGTALVHSVMLAAKQGHHQGWSLALSIATFCLCMVGFFLVRSGVLISVHTFATDPTRGRFVLMMLCAMILVSWFMYIKYADRFSKPHAIKLGTRESLLLFNNAMLMVSAAIVLFGTLYPLALEAVGGAKLSVGGPYFNKALALPMFLLMLGMGVAIHKPWGALKSSMSRSKWVWLLVVAAALTVGLPWAWFGQHAGVATVGLFMGFWVLCSVVFDVFKSFKHRQSKQIKLGMWSAHCGFAMLMLVVCIDAAYQTQQEVALTIGEQQQVGEWNVVLTNIDYVNGPNYVAQQGTVFATRGDKEFQLFPEKRLYSLEKPVMTEADIIYRPVGDIYVALGESTTLENGKTAWSARILFKPFISFLWLSGALMAFGGLWATLMSLKQRRVVA